MKFGLGFGDIEFIERPCGFGAHFPRQIVVSVEDITASVNLFRPLGYLVTIRGHLLGMGTG
jgi:hypothetical protein